MQQISLADLKRKIALEVEPSFLDAVKASTNFEELKLVAEK